MKIKIILLCFLSVVVSNVLQADDKINVQAVLKTVTVFKSGAEMGHVFSAALKAGNNEIWVEGISNAIDINSIQLKAPAAVTVMGVEFSTNYLQPVEKSARVKMLEDSLENIDKGKARLILSLDNDKDLLEVLKANRDIKGTENGLSVTELMKLVDYYKSKSLELQNDIQLLTEKKNKLELYYDKIKKQLEGEQKKNAITGGRLILQLNAAMPGRFDFTLSYIATHAYWIPLYDIKADAITNPLKIIYKAKIFQTTGVDWKQVKLSLSTSMPSQFGNAPVLESWYLGYVNPVQVLEKNLQGKAAGINIRGTSSLNDVVVVGYGTRKEDADEEYKPAKPIYVVNGNIMSEDEFKQINPSSIKKMNVLKDKQATAIYGARASGGAIEIELKEGLQDYISVADNTLNVSFDIDMPYDVPANGKAQTAILQTIDIAATYQHYAVPKLDRDVYLLAHITGWGKLNLLPGEANIIVEGVYIGKSFIDPSATSDTLKLTLGRDKRVIVKRDKIVDFSSVKFLGSNKIQKFTYEITVRNNKKEAVSFDLKDQYPLSTNKEIEVELLDAGGAEVNKDMGELNWKLQLAPGESKKVRFSYSAKYPKDKMININ
ncbi:MAG: mucoidy inhibitor MuiA family protein [Bacteroidota bacterium]|nr:mucoidy inhibitor MuiA family protein [Bacteroidota bacterium]